MMKKMREKVEISKSVYVFGGKPVIRGTRISVDLITSYIASDLGVKEIKRDYPTLTDQQIRAAIDYYDSRARRERVKIDPSPAQV